MTKLKIHRGTPQHGDTLCRSCQHCLCIEGHAVSQEVMLCSANNYASPIRIGFPVARCSEYKNRADTKLHEMEEIAWRFVTKGTRQIGFLNPSEFKKKQSEEL